MTIGFLEVANSLGADETGRRARRGRRLRRGGRKEERTQCSGVATDTTAQQPCPFLKRVNERRRPDRMTRLATQFRAMVGGVGVLDLKGRQR